MIDAMLGQDGERVVRRVIEGPAKVQPPGKGGMPARALHQACKRVPTDTAQTQVFNVTWDVAIQRGKRSALGR